LLLLLLLLTYHLTYLTFIPDKKDIFFNSDIN